MKPRWILRRVASLAVVVSLHGAPVALSGCTCEGDAPEAAPEETPAPDLELTLGLAPEVAAREVARIDDEPLTVLDVAYELEELSPMLAARAADAERRRVLVDSMVSDRALAAEARDRGLDERPEVRRAREEVFVRALVAQLEREVEPPSDEQVRAFFEEHRDRYRQPELRSAGLIFTRDREAGNTAVTGMRNNVRRQPELWMTATEQLGFAGPRRQPRVQTEPFAATAREGEPFVPQVVRDAVFATEPGDLYPEVVPFEDGFYLVRVQERIEPQDLAFDTVREAIRSELHAEAVDAYVTRIVAETLSTATFDEAVLDAVIVPEPAPAGPSAPTLR